MRCFFFKQKTAYEMRISDWSSDVCSSDLGKRVLLILDSLTRVAHAAREIALLLGEPGAARGYPPSALAAITRLVERAGNSARSGGAITGIFSVLADGDDQDDPVVDR